MKLSIVSVQVISMAILLLYANAQPGNVTNSTTATLRTMRTTPSKAVGNATTEPKPDMSESNQIGGPDQESPEDEPESPSGEQNTSSETSDPSQLIGLLPDAEPERVEAQRLLSEMVQMASRLPTLQTPAQMEDMLRLLETLMLSALESMTLMADVSGSVRLSDGPLVLGGQGLSLDSCRRDALQILDLTCRDPGLAIESILLRGRGRNLRLIDLFRRRRQQVIVVIQRNVIVRTLLQTITTLQIVDRGRRIFIGRDFNLRRRRPIRVIQNLPQVVGIGGIGGIGGIIQDRRGPHVPIVGAGQGLLNALLQQGAALNVV